MDGRASIGNRGHATWRSYHLYSELPGRSSADASRTCRPATRPVLVLPVQTTTAASDGTYPENGATSSSRSPASRATSPRTASICSRASMRSPIRAALALILAYDDHAALDAACTEWPTPIVTEPPTFDADRRRRSSSSGPPTIRRPRMQTPCRSASSSTAARRSPTRAKATPSTPRLSLRRQRGRPPLDGRCRRPIRSAERDTLYPACLRSRC